MNLQLYFHQIKALYKYLLLLLTIDASNILVLYMKLTVETRTCSYLYSRPPWLWGMSPTRDCLLFVRLNCICEINTIAVTRRGRDTENVTLFLDNKHGHFAKDKRLFTHYY